MLEKSALSDAIDSFLQDEARITAALIPGLAQLAAKDQPLASPLLTRLRIEAVRRVWGTADVHALALVAMLGEDYDAARSWSGYVQTAMNRDNRLLEELAGLLRRGLGLRGARGDAHAGPCSGAEGALRPRGV